MYEEYFGLNAKPFRITPDPRYLFMSDRHKEGLAHLLYGVTDSGGFIQLTGEVGTGKTTLIRALLEQLPSKVEIALIKHTQITAKEFLREICNEFNIDNHGESTIDLVNTLNSFLLEQHAKGKKIILLIDEAQNLTTHELKTIITRVGHGTKLVLTGDIQQIDNSYVDALSNGLTHAVEKFKEYDIAGHVTLYKGERSRLATLAAEIL